MKFKIHRGTKEIGGSCVEIWTEKTRVLFDYGMPLVEKDGSEFDMGKYKTLTPEDLIEAGILPDIIGIYSNEENLIDGIVLSHAHLDHYGLFNFLKPDLKCYLGQATHKIIEISALFTPNTINICNPVYFEKEKTFQIGDIFITPYWVDHSAFDSYAFLIEADGQRIFYSGDFRGHGRKVKVFDWFLQHVPQNVDYLLLEGTAIGRGNGSFETEEEIEQEFVKLFKEKYKINLVYTSGQNIDRLVSIYRACLRTGKILVVDVYIAVILLELSKFAKIPYPSKENDKLRVIFSYYTCQRLNNNGNEEVFYQFKEYKITKEEISKQSDQIVMIVRPSMQKDLENIKDIDGGNLIYSMWEGYLKKLGTKKFIDYLLGRNFSLHKIHTSGHADVETLREMVAAVRPRFIVPIHTFWAKDYGDIFSFPILELKDGEEINI